MAFLLKFIRSEFSQPAAGGGDVVELFEGVGLVHKTGYFLGDEVCLTVIREQVVVIVDEPTGVSLLLYSADEEHEYEGTITNIASEAQFTPKTIPTNDVRSNMVYAVKISIRNDGYVRTGLSGEVYIDR